MRESYLDNSYGDNACKFFALLTINPKAKVNESKTHVYVNQLQYYWQGGCHERHVCGCYYIYMYNNELIDAT